MRARTRIAAALAGVGLLGVAAGAVACSAHRSGEPPTTPEGTVRFLAEGLGDCRPEVLWQALPVSWQADVTGLVHQAAEGSDPEVWSAGMGVFQKLSRIAAEKRDLILGLPMLASQVKDRAKAEAAWEAVSGVLGTLADSELADRDAMRKLDVEAFLAGTGARLMRQLADASVLAQGTPAAGGLERLRVTDVKVLSSGPEAARLGVSLADGTSSEHDWVRVEGRWVPKALADDWSRAIAQAKQGLAERARQASGRKPVLLVQLRMVDGALDGVLATQTAEEFQAAVTAAAGTLAGAAMAHAQAGQNPFAPRPRVFAPAEGLDRSAADTPGDLSPGIPRLDGAAPGGTDAAVSVSDRPSASGADDHGVLTTHPVPIRDARRYLGQAMHVIGEDGTAFDGTLLAVKPGTLTFQRESAAGTMTHDIALADVESIAIWR